jgi:hypothetical protein
MSRGTCIECGRSGRHATGCPEDVDYDDDTPETCIVCGGDEPCSHDFDKLATPLVSEVHPGRVARFEVDDNVDIVRGGLTLKDCYVLEVTSDPLHDVTGKITNAGKSAKYKVTGYPHWAYDWQLELAKAS